MQTFIEVLDQPLWNLGFGLATVVGMFLGFFGCRGSILTVPLLVYVFRRDYRAFIWALISLSTAILPGSGARSLSL